MSEAPFIKRPKRGIFKRSTRGTGLIEDIAIVSQLGFIMAGSIALSLWIGYKLDTWLQAHGIVLTFFILFGIFGGGWTVYRQIQELYKTSTKKRKDK